MQLTNQTSIRTLAYLTIVAAVATLAVGRMASLPEPTTAITTACDGASVTKPAVRKIDKLVDDYARRRAGIAAALSGCR
jgi:hypothetical protein